jgi:peptide/nickel transport system permease protein
MFGLIVIVFFALIAVFAPLLAPYDPLQQDIPNGLALPSCRALDGHRQTRARHLQPDALRCAHLAWRRAGRGVDLAVIGTLIGIVAGYVGGWTDEGMMRVTDIFFAFPSLILAMAIAGALGPSLENALIAVAVVTWPVYARLIRGQVLDPAQP